MSDSPFTREAIQAAAEAYAFQNKIPVTGLVASFNYMLVYCVAKHKLGVQPSPVVKPIASPSKIKSAPSPEEYVLRLHGPATSESRKSRISPVFLIAQSALECGWGKSGVGTGGNNIFGITANKHYTGAKVIRPTIEFHKTKTVVYPKINSIVWVEERQRFKYDCERWFRDYKTLEACFADHAKVLIHERFTHARPFFGNPKKLAVALQSGKETYATSTIYAETLCKVIDTVERIIEKHRL
jgi:flagellum-specific peptidoglycan hydrolase FlgJ